MIAASRRWFRRYRTPLAIGVGVVSFAYVATQYLIGRISDARDRMTSDRISRENLRRRFEQNQEDCSFTVLALLPTARDNILAELDTDSITEELQKLKAAKLARNGEAHQSELSSEPPSIADEDGKSMVSLQSESGVHASQLGLPSTSNFGQELQDSGEISQKVRRSKLQLWNDLKITAITRSFTMIYILALLTLLTRIQLNLLGRRNYLSSVISLATGGSNQSTIILENHDDDSPDQAYGEDFDTNRKYLTFSWWLLHSGWSQVMLKVEAAVIEVFGGLSIRDDLSMEKFSELTLEVRKKVEGATAAGRQESKWLRYLLPPREQEDFVLRESGMTVEGTPSAPSSTSASSTISLRRLLDETSDLIDSPPFAHVLTLLLDAGFTTLVDQKISQQGFKVPPNFQTSDQGPQEMADIKPVKLPIILAALNRQARSIGDGAKNEYLEAMEQVRDLEAFAAVVYSSNWENEINPVRGEEGSQQDDIVFVPEDAGKDSVIDVGTASTFESVWGKAVDGLEKT